MTKLIPTLLLLIILLAACGNGGETAESPVPPTVETAVEEAAESAPQEVVEEAAPAEGAEESVPPVEDALPVQEPLLIDTPQPTEEPQVIVIEGDPVTGEGWGESGTTAQSACDHPYFPLRSGMTWSMAGGDGEPINWEVVDVQGDLEAATAELKMRTAGLEFTYTWECSAAGGIASYGFGNQGLSALGPEVEIEVVEGSGLFLPDPGNLQPGYSWDANYKTVYSMTQLDGDLEMEISGEMDTLQTSAVVSIDPVSYQGETVPGLLIQQDTQIDTVMTMFGETVENSMLMGAQMELGWGLGMLRQTTFTEFGDFTAEVTEIYVP